MELVGLLTVLLALGTALFGFVLHRWGVEEETDSLVLLYRRIRGVKEPAKGRKRPKAWEEWPAAPVGVRAEARGRGRFGRRRSKKDAEGEEPQQAKAHEAAGGLGVSRWPLQAAPAPQLRDGPRGTK
jgi:hypothetical protein